MIGRTGNPQEIFQIELLTVQYSRKQRPERTAVHVETHNLGGAGARVILCMRLRLRPALSSTEATSLE
jgi:hypothetical protein